MSIIIGAHVHDGIVVASDTRTTVIDGNGNTMYKDDAVKIIPFPNRMVVAHCRDANVSKNMTVNEFLIRCRVEFGNGCRIFDLPTKLLSEFKKLNVFADITFLVAGFYNSGFGSCIYKVETKNKIISMPWCDGTYGASYYGANKISDSILNGADYDSMSLTGAIDLISLAVNTTIKAYSFRNPQSVGGQCRMYVLSTDDKCVGWYTNGKILTDKDAPIDSYEHLMQAKTEQIMEQGSKG